MKVHVKFIIDVECKNATTRDIHEWIEYNLGVGGISCNNPLAYYPLDAIDMPEIEVTP